MCVTEVESEAKCAQDSFGAMKLGREFNELLSDAEALKAALIKELGDSFCPFPMPPVPRSPGR